MLGYDLQYAPCTLRYLEMMCVALSAFPVHIAELVDAEIEDALGELDDAFGEVSILWSDPDVEIF